MSKVNKQNVSQTNKISKLQVVSNIKLQTMSGSRRRMWKKRGGSTRLSFMSNSSLENHHLADTEEEFLHAAEFGDIPTVKRILQENPNLNVDCIDALGRTALRLSVKNEHLEIVEVLLDRSSGHHIYEAVLQAISAGHIQIAETILKHRRYLEMWKERKKLGDDDYFFNKSMFEESQFSPDITPLILAAHKNQYEVVQLLMLRGEIINKPHKFQCACQECTNKMKFDKLRSAKYRLNAYRGLASEAYISLSSKDPILTAFELGAEVKHLSRVEKYFKREYKDLAEGLSEYVVRLLSRVRTQEELEIVLNKAGNPRDNKYESLARFKLAIRYNEKKFVAHSSCQQRMVSTWYEGIGVLERASWPKRVLLFMLFFISYPFLVLIYLFAPRAKCIRILRYPCVKFICHMMSFLSFLVLIIVSTAETSKTVSKHTTLNSKYPDIYAKYVQIFGLTNQTLYGIDFPMRPLIPTITQLMLSTWVLGMACQECSQLFTEGLRRYAKSWYNLMDVSLLTLYCSSFTLRYFCMIKAFLSVQSIRGESVDDLSNDLLYNEKWPFYWLNADRFYWDSWDPINMSEGLFAVANILSFSRISYLLPANEALGPLQISLGRMIKDILKFLAFIVLVFSAFMVGLNNLFWYYSMRESIEVTKHNFTTRAEVQFADVLATFRTVFWSLFGRGDTDVVKLGEYENKFTEDIGYIIYGAYNIAMVIVLLNMLIAMMTRSYQDITEDADVEWKFARSVLYMDYIGEGSVLPVPLNMLGLPKAIVRKFTRCCSKCCESNDNETPEDGNPDVAPEPMERNGRQNGLNGARSRARSRDNLNLQLSDGHLKPADIDRRRSTESLPFGKKSYHKVMQTIVQRYIFDMQREAEVTEDDFEEIKQDISSFRYEMLNTLTVREKQHDEVMLKLSQILGVPISPLEKLKSRSGTPIKQMSIDEEYVSGPYDNNVEKSYENSQIVCEADINVETSNVELGYDRNEQENDVEQGGSGCERIEEQNDKEETKELGI
ncbi:short transient receptor potential channel 7-like [Mytilus trossulus]|uniref:short transient receptor potential channel 7-like n=1 Tax=Mytilus trossulus TaxID=6551 RepID=UPI0030059B6E